MHFQDLLYIVYFYKKEKLFTYPIPCLTDLFFSSNDKNKSVVKWFLVPPVKNYADFMLYRSNCLRSFKKAVQQWNFEPFITAELEIYDLGIDKGVYFYSMSFKNPNAFLNLRTLNYFRLHMCYIEYFSGYEDI